MSHTQTTGISLSASEESRLAIQRDIFCRKPKTLSLRTGESSNIKKILSDRVRALLQN